jgi:hypothetical protein
MFLINNMGFSELKNLVNLRIRFLLRFSRALLINSKILGLPLSVETRMKCFRPQAKRYKKSISFPKKKNLLSIFSSVLEILEKTTYHEIVSTLTITTKSFLSSVSRYTTYIRKKVIIFKHITNYR